MTIEELKKGEYETVEYKQDIPKDKGKYLKTAIAFANGAGGRLIFGVENNTWNVLGFSDDEVFQKYDAIANSIYDACTPSVVPVMGIEEVDGRKIIVANILPGMGKPYYLRSVGMMEGTYIRIAGVTRKAEPYMIKELQLEGTNTGFDSMQVAGDAVSNRISMRCATGCINMHFPCAGMTISVVPRKKSQQASLFPGEFSYCSRTNIIRPMLGSC